MLKIELPEDLAQALAEGLKNPRKDAYGDPGYFINATDAYTLRMAIAGAQEQK